MKVPIIVNLTFFFLLTHHPWDNYIPEASTDKAELKMHTSMWSRKRRARNLVSSRKNGEPAKEVILLTHPFMSRTVIELHLVCNKTLTQHKSSMAKKFKH